MSECENGGWSGGEDRDDGGAVHREGLLVDLLYLPASGKQKLERKRCRADCGQFGGDIVLSGHSDYHPWVLLPAVSSAKPPV